jgi:hypothetical protein
MVDDKPGLLQDSAMAARIVDIELGAQPKQVSRFEWKGDDADAEVKPGGINMPAPPPPGSLKTLPARIEFMRDKYLGKHIPIGLGGPGNQAKRAVMNESCAKTGVKPIFSRMTGIQEWSNAIFLFVNVSAESSNDFQEDGQLISWFAQNRQSEASAQVQRLIHHATGVEYPSKEILPSPVHEIRETIMLPPCAVALVCRLEGEPYIWCGELEYVSHDHNSHPLRFIWRLKDHALLTKQEQFLHLINSKE